MWIIVTPSPRHKPCASCSKNNRKWPGVFIALLCLSWSDVLHRLLWSFSWERIQLVSAGDLHALHPTCSLLNLHSPPSTFLCFLKVCCILGLLCSWHDGPPPRSANRNPGNQHVWPKPICFTRFTNPQWDVMRKKPNPHVSGPEFLKSAVHARQRQKFFCAFRVFLRKKLMTPKPFYQNPGLALQDRLVHSWDSLCSENHFHVLYFQVGSWNTFPFIPFSWGGIQQKVTILMERSSTYCQPQPSHLSADLNIVKRLCLIHSHRLNLAWSLIEKKNQHIWEMK